MAEKPSKPPLRGEAAYRAQKLQIAKNNDAAQAAAMRRRAQKETASVKEAAKVAQREMRGLRDS
jgi:hypothetical protein